MSRKACLGVCAAMLVLFAAPFAVADGGYFDRGETNAVSQQVSAAAILAAASGSVKASLAASVGNRAASASAMSKGTSLYAFDSISSVLGRKLQQAGSGGEPRRPVGQGTTYYDAGDRAITAQQSTGSAIQAAILSGKAQLASSLGLGAARTATKRSAGPKTFDSIGHRKLLGA